ncbi:MAG: NAD(+) synthase [Sandaracinaceae bacterium]|nr:NAD(+) synthase [Sandaracinaceae bacterium]
MRIYRAGVASLNQTPLDFEGNEARVADAVSRAKREGLDLLLLPELALSGHSLGDFSRAEWVHDRLIASLGRIAEKSRDLSLVLGMPFLLEGMVYSAAAVLHDGELLGLATKGGYDRYAGLHEAKHFDLFPRQGELLVDLLGASVPIGRSRFSLGSLRAEVAIGDALESFERLDGPSDLLLNPAARPFRLGTHGATLERAAELSLIRNAPLLSANLLGNEAGRNIFDGASFIAADGELLTSTPRLSMNQISLRSAALRLTDTIGTRSRRERASTPPPLQYEEHREELLTRAMAVGLFDYLRKSRANGYVLSLSGGADSAACAALIGLMIRLGVKELGTSGFKKRLAHIASLEDASNAEELCAKLLLTAYQSTENSSETTRSAARALAEEIGATHLELDIQPMVDAYRAFGEQAIGRALDFENDDLALQNLQARVRSPGAWLLANLRGAIVITTSNRSELSVGYLTMDGDTSGGLAPIASIDKAYLREYLVWLEKEGPKGIGPLKSLEKVNVQEPTAELRPLEAQQRDEDDLMPYPLLDRLEELLVHRLVAPETALRVVREEFSELEGIENYVDRFLRSFSTNQWKRARIAPSFILSDRIVADIDFPILNGGLRLASDG